METQNLEKIKAGYGFAAQGAQLGVLRDDATPRPDVPIRIPLAMLNRHGLVSGATGTGKTVTLQVLAEQCSRAGIPVFAADIKGDLSGLASAGTQSEKLLDRVSAQGQPWTSQSSPCEFYALGAEGVGIPIRASIGSFGATLLAKVLGLNDIQESSLGLVFYWAEYAKLPLVDLADLTAVLRYLLSDEGKAQLKSIGGLSSATVGVILRELINLSAQGGDVFFGEPEFDPADLLRTTADGAGVVSVLELPKLQDRPGLFSTFLMWLLTVLYRDLPEVGDLDRPKLVFFFDEAHLLFKDASKAFLSVITQTVRLIRSKGVGVFFVTQTPKDVPDDVLAQLGSRIQHQLRAHTPKDAKDLKQVVDTYPITDYDLVQLLQQLATGEAVVTVQDPSGAPTPVAWTRIWAPESAMSPTAVDVLQQMVASSPLQAKYADPVDRTSAHELLNGYLSQSGQTTPVAAAAPPPAATESSIRVRQQAQERQAIKQAEQAAAKQRAADERAAKREAAEAKKAAERRAREASKVVNTVAREVIRGIFKR